jgi:hypothetical protein
MLNSADFFGRISYAMVRDRRLSPSAGEHQTKRPDRTEDGELLLVRTCGSDDLARVSVWFCEVASLLTIVYRLGHTINKFRMKLLNLPYLSTQSAVGMIERCGVPWTYCLSPALVPQPQDWMSHIGMCATLGVVKRVLIVRITLVDVVGFYFLDLAKGYVPPKSLEQFLDAGEPPIYIG